MYMSVDVDVHVHGKNVYSTLAYETVKAVQGYIDKMYKTNVHNMYMYIYMDFNKHTKISDNT